MESLYLLVPISVLLVFIIGALFWWSLRSGQFDDLEGPAYRMLLDDRDDAMPPPAESIALAAGASAQAPDAKQSEGGP